MLFASISNKNFSLQQTYAEFVKELGQTGVGLNEEDVEPETLFPNKVSMSQLC